MGLISVHVENLNYRYPSGAEALREVRLSVDGGERVGLVGPNGAGKTTLFLCLAGVLPVTPGTVRVAGLDPAVPRDRRELPRRLGMLFQDSDDQLFCPTLRHDVAFGPRQLGLSADAVDHRVEESLRRVGLEAFGDRAPHRLSGGEKRRAALAGVLATHPEVVLLDEPSAHLDPRARRQMIELLGALRSTTLVATHDLDLVLDTCRRAVLLDRGEVVVDGDATQILSDRALMEAHGLEVPYCLR